MEECYNCGGYGHIRAQCPSIFSMENGTDEPHENEEECPEFFHLDEEDDEEDEQRQRQRQQQMQFKSQKAGIATWNAFEALAEDSECKLCESGSFATEDSCGAYHSCDSAECQGRGGAFPLRMAAMPKHSSDFPTLGGSANGVKARMPKWTGTNSTRTNSWRRNRRQKKTDDIFNLDFDYEDDIMEMTSKSMTKGYKNGWRMISAVVDSGAVRPVLPSDVSLEIKVEDTAESRSGHSFSGAGKNGKPIPNLGQVKFVGVTMEGHKRQMTWTVASVRKPLISVSKLEDAGNDVTFGKDPRIVNAKTGQVTKMRRQGGVYVVDLWVKVGNSGGYQEGTKSNDSPGFTRPR